MDACDDCCKLGGAWCYVLREVIIITLRLARSMNVWLGHHQAIMKWLDVRMEVLGLNAIQLLT